MLRGNWMSRRIFIIDDDENLCGVLARFLKNHEFDCQFSLDIAGARDALTKYCPDLILMDVNLPDGSGFEFTREIRVDHKSAVPIIMLTGRHSEIDVVVGFDQGADDYIAKPFRTAELLARVQAVLRRAEPSPTRDENAPQPPQTARFGPWTLDLDTRTLAGVGRQPVSLTRAEYNLLIYFLKTAGKIIPKERLMGALVENEEASDQAIEARIYRLRKKIEPNLANPTLLTTRRGEGYLFTANVTWNRQSESHGN